MNETPSGNGHGPAAKGDGFEEVDGNATKNVTVFGLRVKSASIKEDDDGGASAEITVAGIARGMTRLVGESTEIATIDGVRRMHGHVRSVTITEGKESGQRTVAVKMGGARQLAELVGRPVQLVQRQGELPGVVSDEVEAEEGPARIGEVDAPAAAARRRKKGGGRSRGKRAATSAATPA